MISFTNQNKRTALINPTMAFVYFSLDYEFKNGTKFKTIYNQYSMAWPI